MKLVHVMVQNFGSYKYANLDFTDNGLTLISGDTGVGKSTILDFVAWTLFGVTSKNGAVDDVRSWTSDSATRGECTVKVRGQCIEIFRDRSNSNDLYYTLETVGAKTAPIRGKDLNDTQRLINQALQCDADLYLNAAYIQQFAEGDKFFAVKPKERREFVEQIADLSLSIKLFERSRDERLVAKEVLEGTEDNILTLTTKRDEGKKNLEAINYSFYNWQKKTHTEVQKLKEATDNFEADRSKRQSNITQELTTLKKSHKSTSFFDKKFDQLKKKEDKLGKIQNQISLLRTSHIVANRELAALKVQYSKIYELMQRKICPTCNSSIEEDAKNNELKIVAAEIEAQERAVLELEKETEILAKQISSGAELKVEYKTLISDSAANDRILAQIETLELNLKELKNAKNTYAEQLEVLKKAQNPVDALKTKAFNDLEGTKAKLVLVELEHKEQSRRVQELTWLYNKSFELRGWQMEQATLKLANVVNENLEKYFDASLRISIKVAELDKIEAEINNSGYACKYTQLSGGERALLNFVLKFAVITLVEDKAGVSFSTVMLDEVLNGMSDDLKLKAFNFLQSLTKKYENIFLIDHCEAFKNMFDNRINVTKIGNVSHIAYEM